MKVKNNFFIELEFVYYMIMMGVLLDLSVDCTNDVNELLRGESHNEAYLTLLHRDSTELSISNTL